MGVKLVASSGGSVELVPTNTASNFTVTVPASTTTMVGTDATQTLTNKTLTSPALTTPIASTTIGVGGATPSASGAGITFPATQSASSDANTLDDYEEGTFTVGVSGAGGPTVIAQSNTYTKVGRLVTVNIYILIRQNTATGGQVITGLPFFSTNTTNYVATGVGYWENTATSIINSICKVSQNSTSLSISRTTSAVANPVSWQGGDWQSASDTLMTFTITYMTD